VLALLAVGLGAAALYRLGDVRSDLLDGAAPAREAGENLSAALLNQETGIRGYDLTGRDEFLQPYRDGFVAEQEAARTLRALSATTELGAVAADLGAVERAAQRWRTEFAEPVVATGALVPGAPSVDPERGRALFDDVRAAVDVLNGHLAAEQAVARDAVNAAARSLVAFAVGIAVVLTAFIVAVGIGLRRGVLGPVSRLAAGTREVVDGDVQREVHGSGPREIVELGADVEAMRAHIVRELGTLQEVNRRLDQQTRDLERSNRDLEQFAYVASHDLQEPLRKVSSFCQLLQRRYGGQLDERADQYIGFAVDGAQRMQRLINDLLSFSRVGRTTERFETVDLDEVTAAAAEQLEATRVDTDGTITVGALPAVRGDRALLQQLLVNLVGNGLKFHRDGVPPVVEVTAQARDGQWEIAISDNGIGVEPEFTDKVFIIFQRLHARDVYEGTGIGLALAKKIVEFHGGRIWIERSDGPGATIRFTLPALPADPAPQESS
jgi:signal transduction histidine kinase